MIFIKYNLKSTKNDLLIKFSKTIMNIKYCKNINIPEILIDNKNAVKKESKKI